MQTQCILVSEIGRFEWTRKTLRPLDHDEALVRVEVTGLCRTDLKIIRHGHRDLVLALVSVGVASRQPAASAQGSDPGWKPVTVIYLSDTRGKTEPCG